jgi:hypothetical protein
VRRLTRPLLVLLAIIFLIEAWLWDHLKPIVAWVVSFFPWKRVKARIVSVIESLPPYATLFVFIIPVIVLFPLKLLGLWMLAHGFWLGAVGVLVLAKLTGVGVAAFIFEITRPKLLPRRAGRTMRLLSRIRRRVRAQAA